MNLKRLLIPAAALLAATAFLQSSTRNEDLSRINFAAECTTPSDPTDRLLFGHEEMVSAFLNTPLKQFGPGRMVEMHLGSPFLPTHGGSTQVSDEWTQAEIHYELAPGWGLIGSVKEKEPLVYTLKAAPFLGFQTGMPKKRPGPEENKLDHHAADLFEQYALRCLAKGDPIVRWERADSVRAVGAIRCSSACQRCHDIKEGELLGAFTYEFAKSKAPETSKEHQEIVRRSREGQGMKQMATEMFPRDKYSGRAVWYGLLASGIVTDEMVKIQAANRKDLLEWISSSFGKTDETPFASENPGPDPFASPKPSQQR
jgi:hypothetical protein